MSKHLETITLEFTEGTYAPNTGSTVNDPPKLCDACAFGHHDKCTGVYCYRCPRENHPMLPGLTSTADPDERKTVGGKLYK